MTANINNQTATASVASDGTITIKIDGQQLKLTAEQATSVITATLAGRKEAYELHRAKRNETREASKAERTAKKAERDAKTAERKAEQLKKLQERLEKLQNESKAA